MCWGNSEICHLFVIRCENCILNCILEDSYFSNSFPMINIFYFRTKCPRAVDIFTLAKYIHQTTRKKARAFQHISVASRKSVQGNVRNDAGTSSPVTLWMSFAGEWIKRTISRLPRRFFTDGSGLLGGRKIRRGCCLKNEPSDDDPVYWSLQIALAEGKGKEEEGAKDYPFYIISLILLFMNLTSSEPSRKG